MEARYRRGECLLAAGKLPEARKEWRELLKSAPSVSVTPNPSPAPVRPDMPTRLRREGMPPPAKVEGKRLVPNPTPKRNEEGKAIYTSENLRRLQDESERSQNPSSAKDDAPRDWPAEAAFHLAETWRCPNPGNEEDLRRGVAALEDFLHRFPSHELAGTAILEIAQSQLSLGHQDEAAATLQRFLQDPRWKDCKELPRARQWLGQIYFGQEKYAEALAVWREYLTRYTAQEGWSAVEQCVIDTEYLMGVKKNADGDDAAATRLLTEFMARYPLDARNPDILFAFGEMHYRQKKWEAAIADWQRLVTKYPRSEGASHAQFMVARTLEEQLDRYDDAREHYRLVAGRDAAAAQAALAAIPAKSMEVKTERVFASRETPQLKLATRNVPAVKVRVYKIDLETYFRKMHSIAGIQRLDVLADRSRYDPGIRRPRLRPI